MTRFELERKCRDLFFEPTADDTDDDLRLVIATRSRVALTI